MPLRISSIGISADLIKAESVFGLTGGITSGLWPTRPRSTTVRTNSHE